MNNDYFISNYRNGKKKSVFQVELDFSSQVTYKLLKENDKN